MNRMLTSAALILSLFGLFACGGDDNNGVGGGNAIESLSISPITQNVINKASTASIQVICDKTPIVSSNASWCTVSGRNAMAKGYEVTFSIAENNDSEDRTANITISVGNNSQKATITQAAKDGILLTINKAEIGNDGGELTVELKANGDFSVTTEADWITKVGTRVGMKDYKYVLRIAENSGNERKATVLFTLGNASESLTITQEKGCQRIVVDLNSDYQTIEGFAASDCWAPAVIGKYWTSKRDHISELLFSKEIVNGQPKGIGLSMWRSNLGAGSAEQGLNSEIGVENGANGYNYYRRAESYLNDDLSYDWTRCEGQRYFLDRAKQFGVESIVLFSNSPNVQYTKNGKAFSNSNHNANLKSDCYDDFASYLAKVAKQYQSWGYPVTHISPVNEPQYTWDGHDQEGSGWSNTEIAKLARELDTALSEEGIDTKILLAEASAWDVAVQTVSGYTNSSNSIDDLFSSSSNNYVGDLTHVAKVFGAHSYWTDSNWNGMRDWKKKAADKASANGIALWQTEWSMLGDGYYQTEFVGYDKASEMDIALYMSRVIHNDLTVANVTSWSFWTSMDVTRWGQKNRFMLIDFVPAGGTYSIQLEGEGEVNDQPNLWVLGNYSLFVRPGYKRVDINLSESINFFSSAYVSPDGKEIIVVITNMEEQKQNLKIGQNSWNATNIKSYTTTAKKKLQEASLTPSSELSIEPKSVTTLVISL